MPSSRLVVHQCVVCTLIPVLLFFSQASKSEETCLAFVTHNLAKGNGNWYTYFTFSKNRLTLKKGDVLVYSIFLDPSNPEAKGGIDLSFTEGNDVLRDHAVSDQNGQESHGDTVLSKAVGHWITRKFPLQSVVGKTVSKWNIQAEADSFGRYVQFLRDIVVEHQDGTRTVIYAGGPPTNRSLDSNAGYTELPICVPIKSSLVEADLPGALASVEKLGAQSAKLDSARSDVDLAKKFLETHPDPDLKAHIDEAEQALKTVSYEDVTASFIEQVLHTVQHALSHVHPQMEKYTGHLVGHAHIDLQWLWEWQEGMVATHDTFNQAAKFMDEYPGFKFSQSSSCLYQSVQDNWPDLFKTIKGKVKSGQWELVGGRVCEADTNMISPESHIRQFLYGQLYFQENFGKTATVGWEPDTFGHTIQMPQILKLGGLDSYYFCRGGQGKPLFWWQGLDGTKILSFDELASGSWYNSDLSYKQFSELLDFEKATGGAKDTLWVYGIGNHGGGPSREYIETALGWMKDKTKPKVKFSTANQFFSALKKYDLTKIPVIGKELNPVFEGCYTSHAEIKQLNRASEYATTAAESVSTVASLFGFKYPRADFRKNWEDICFNQHHDTLPGSGIHAPYERTKTSLGKVLALDKDITMRALESLTLKVKPENGGFSVMVFNPSGWTRSGIVRHWIGGTGWEGDGVVPSRCVATSPDGVTVPVYEVDPNSHRAEFWATDVPAMGWKVFHLTNKTVKLPTLRYDPTDSTTSIAGYDWIGGDLGIKFNKATGAIASISDMRQGGTFINSKGGLGLPELHVEQDDGMSAWVLGKIKRILPCKVIHSESGPDGVTFEYEIPWEGARTGTSTLKQTFRTEGRQIIVDVDCDWNAIGTAGKEAPFLRFAFKTGLSGDSRFPVSATYEVPFGAIQRPIDGKEGSMLNWADVSDGQLGIAVLNESKSGASTSMTKDGAVIRMSVIRSSTGPDPNPNPGHHHWRYAIVPHLGDWRAAFLPRLGVEFQSPLLSATVPFDAHGPLPSTWSLLNVPDSSTLVTGIKRAEKSDDLIVHLYDSLGSGSKSTIEVNVPLSRASNVNFIENHLTDLKVDKGRVSMQLHPFEIQCFKLKLQLPAK